MIALVFALTLAAADAPAEAATPVAPIQVESKKERAARLKEEKLNKVVCRKIVQTGSNVRNDVCRTQREWDAERRVGQAALQRVQQDGLNTFIAGHH